MAPPVRPDGAEAKNPPQESELVAGIAESEGSKITQPPAAQGAEQLSSIEDTSREEVMAVIRQVFNDGISRDRETAIHDLSRALGFQRTGSRIQEVLHGDLKAASRRRILRTDRGLLSLDCRSIHDYDREFLKKALLSVMSQSWWDQAEAIRAAGRSIGFLRTGSSIQQAFKSAINGAVRTGLLERDGNYLRRP